MAQATPRLSSYLAAICPGCLPVMGNSSPAGCVCQLEDGGIFSHAPDAFPVSVEDSQRELEELLKENEQLKLDHDRLQHDLERERPVDLPLGTDSACDGSVPQIINDLVLHMWPFISQYVHNLLKDEIEPMVQQMLPKFVGFKFSDTRCNLGKRPPELGVTVTNVHDQASAEFGQFKSVRIVAELLYDGDCEVEVEALGSSIGVSALQVTGFLVVELVHLLNRPPMFQGLRIYFINPPDIRIGMEGSLGHLLNEHLLKQTIVDAVSKFISGLMVLPNRITTPLEDELNVFRLKAPPPEGVLRVVVDRGRGLSPTERGTSDPYVVIQVGAESWRTSTKSKSLDPEWDSDSTFDFIIYDQSSQQLRLSVFSRVSTLKNQVTESFKRTGACCCSRRRQPVKAPQTESSTTGESLSDYVDNFLGYVQISLQELVVNQRGEAWLDLQPLETHATMKRIIATSSMIVPQGSVRVRAEFRPFLSDRPDPSTEGWSIPNCASGTDTVALLFAGVFGASCVPYPPNEADQHWCATTVTEVGRMGVTETRESPKLPALHPVHRFQLGKADDPRDLDEQRKKIRETIDTLHAAAVPAETISQAVGLPLHCVAAQVSNAPDVEQVFAAADGNSVDLLWEEPMFFALRSSTAACSFKVLRGDNQELGAASANVEALLSKEKLTDHLRLKLGDSSELEVVLKLLVLGRISAGCGFSKAADS